MKFKSFADFVKWYNIVRYHESLDTKHYLQTPENAFWSRLPDGCKLNVCLKRMEARLREKLENGGYIKSKHLGLHATKVVNKVEWEILVRRTNLINKMILL
ncbi:MAG: hypothetical protein C5617_000740 [ANME-2 cluster archaeon]|jgi:G:T/U-mismatch repair DNA glycosylase|nr:MAG: hypothetical protein C5617_000740 [ANME-2 cluster archaeon]